MNSLEVGHPRVGWLYDGSPDTPPANAMLENTGTAIILTIPLEGAMGRRSPYARWFHGGARFGDDPDRTKFSYEPPTQMTFQDHEGPVGLIGAHVVNMRASVYAGIGRLAIDYAILGGANLKYQSVNALRSEIARFADWTSASSVNIERDLDEVGKFRNWVIRLDSPGPTRLAPRLNLALHPTWSTSGGQTRGSLTANDHVELRTNRVKPAPLHEHLQLHHSMRDLASLSCWKPLGFIKLRVNRTDDPTRSVGGSALGESWPEVLTYVTPPHRPVDKSPQFIFEFNDIGPKGVRAWLRLSARFRRGLEPLVGLLEQEDALLETRLVQSSIALEALGYQLGVDGGRYTGTRTREATYESTLKQIQSDLKFRPIADWKDWRRRSNRTYIGTKHPDNELPDTATQLITYFENITVMRYWIAERLGVSRERLERAHARDPIVKAWL